MGSENEAGFEPRALSPEEIALLSRVTEAVPDMLAAGRVIFPADRLVETIPKAVRELEERVGARLEYMGNWWVSGNPYKGINCVFVTTEGPGAGWERFELQFHTRESADLAQKNHALYEIERDPKRPLAERQRAFDEMVASFAKIPHPPGIEDLGEQVVTTRPISAVERERIEREKSESAVNALLANIVAKTGASVVGPAGRPHALQKLLDDALELSEAEDHPGALRLLDEAIEKYSPQMATDGIGQGVTLAMLRSSGALTHLGRYDEALARCDEVIEICRDDYCSRLLGMYAREHQAYEAKQWIQRTMAEKPLIEAALEALHEASAAGYADQREKQRAEECEKAPKEERAEEQKQGTAPERRSRWHRESVQSKVRRWFSR